MNDSATRDFSLGTLLSCIDGRLMTEFRNVHELLDWVTEDQLYTHQLPRAMDEAEPFLKAQFPDLTALLIDPTVFDGDTVDEVQASITQFLDSLVADCGFSAAYSVPRMPKNEHTKIGPLEELAMNYPNKKVIAVNRPTEGIS